MNKRISDYLNELKNELRKRALKEKNEEKCRDYWRLYYKAVDAAHEVDNMVADAEIRTLIMGCAMVACLRIGKRKSPSSSSIRKTRRMLR